MRIADLSATRIRPLKGAMDMNTRKGDRLDSLLFEQGHELVNIKFFPGDDPTLTPDQLREAAADALEAAHAQTDNSPPRTGRQKTTLDDFQTSK
jgi:hypothetical protein